MLMASLLPVQYHFHGLSLPLILFLVLYSLDVVEGFSGENSCSSREPAGCIRFCIAGELGGIVGPGEDGFVAVCKVELYENALKGIQRVFDSCIGLDINLI